MVNYEPAKTKLIHSEIKHLLYELLTKKLRLRSNYEAAIAITQKVDYEAAITKQIHSEVRLLETTNHAVG